MTTRIFVAIVAVLTLLAICMSPYDADARRFGGARSFGGSSSFSRSFSSSRLPSSAVKTPSATQQKQGVGTGATTRRPGFGVMGGILGGLLAGSLLGSLLSGHGFAGGSFLDILLIGLIVFFVFRLLGRRRSTSVNASTSPYGMRMSVPDRDNTLHRETAKGTMDWSMFGGQPSASGQSAAADGHAEVHVPEGFDTEEFLRGAKMAYRRLNDSWDKRDLDDIAEFSTHPFMAEIRQQARESPEQEKNEIVLVNARLVDVVQEAGRETASVYFDVLMRESFMPADAAPEQVREVWHFVRAVNSQDMWKLDGIQQVED